MGELVNHWTPEEINHLKTVYPLNDINRLKILTNRSEIAIRAKAHKLRIRFNPDSYKQRKPMFKYSNEIKAKVIEHYVNNPDTQMEALDRMFGFPSHGATNIISSYFAYKGPDKVVISLMSKV